jgi:hypothetical protein
VSNGLREASLTLAPGDGELYELTEDPSNRPVVYRDDFTTDKLLADAIVTVGLAPYASNLHDYVLSAITGTAWPNAFMTYDLNQRLGTLPANGLRVISYRGKTTSPESRGVQWASSSNGTSYTTFSQNQFERAVPVRQRFLRGSVSWYGGSSYDYGYLSDFTLWQWKSSARTRR